MQYYSFDRETGEYKGARGAPIDPLESANGEIVFRHPGRFETPVPPPPAAKGYVAVHSQDEWTLQPDHRGETWWRDWQTPIVVDVIGTPVGLTPTQPAPPLDVARAHAWDAIHGEGLAKRAEMDGQRGDAHALKGQLALNAKDDSRPVERDQARGMLAAYAAARGESGWEAVADKIIAARNQWSSRTMALEGLEDAAWRALEQARSVDQVAEIKRQITEAIRGV